MNELNVDGQYQQMVQQFNQSHSTFTPNDMSNMPQKVAVENKDLYGQLSKLASKIDNQNYNTFDSFDDMYYPPGTQGKNGSLGVNSQYPKHLDPFRGQQYKWKVGPKTGTIDTIVQTIDEGGIQYVYMKGGEKISVLELSQYFNTVQFNDAKVSHNKIAGLEYSDKDYNQSAITQHTNIVNRGGQKGPPPIDPDLEFGPPGDSAINSHYINANIDTPVSQLKDMKPPTQNNTVQKTVKKVEVFNPVMEIIKKMKKSPKDIELKLSLSLPSKELFDTLSESFDDVDKVIVEYILSNQNINELKLILLNAVRGYYSLEPVTEDVYITHTDNNEVTEISEVSDVEDIVVSDNLEPVVSEPNLLINDAMAGNLKLQPINNPNLNKSIVEQSKDLQNLRQALLGGNTSTSTGINTNLANSFSNSNLSETQQNRLKDFLGKS